MIKNGSPEVLFHDVSSGILEVHGLGLCQEAAAIERQYRIDAVRAAITDALRLKLSNPSVLPAERDELQRITSDWSDNASAPTISLSRQYEEERERPLERGLRQAQLILRNGYCETQGSGGWKRLRTENRTVRPADPNWFVPLSFTDSSGQNRHFIVYAAPVGLVKGEMYFEDLGDDLRDENWPMPHAPTPKNIMNLNNHSDVVDAVPDSDKSYDTRPGMTSEVYRAMVEQSIRNAWPLPDVVATGDQKTYTLLTGKPLVWHDIAWAGAVSNGVAETGSFGSNVDQIKMYEDFTKRRRNAELFTIRPSLEVDPVTGEIIDVRLPERFKDY